MMAPQHFSHTHLDELAVALDFTRADLAANRRGWLTARQIDHLNADQRRRQWPALVGWVALGGLAVTLAALDLELAAQWIVVGIGLAVLGGMSAYELMLKRLPDDQIKAGWVMLHVGAEWQARRRLALPFPITFEIDGRTFSAPPALESLLHDGQRYRVYYAESICNGTAAGNSDAPCRILSIEPMGPATPVRHDSRRVA